MSLSLRKKYLMSIQQASEPSISPRLPDAYQEVEYIQSSGTQWIDTGVKPFNLETEIDFQYISRNPNEDNWLIGTYCGSNERYYALNLTADAGVNVLDGFDTTGNYEIRYIKSQTGALNRHTLIFNKYNTHAVLFDGVNKGTAPVINTSLNNIYLFRFWNGSSTPVAAATAKLYSCKMKEAGVLIRDFVPCYRKSDGEIGLYDLVNDVFYTNQGSGTFSMGVPILYDSRYQQVEYIQSSGTQVILTECREFEKLKVVQDFQVVSGSGLSGDRASAADWGQGDYDLRLGILWRNNSIFYVQCGNNNIEVSFDYNRHIVSTDNYTNTASFDGTSLTVTPSQLTSPDHPYIQFPLFARVVTASSNPASQTNIITQYAAMKLFSCQIYKEGTLVRYFIPVYRRSDNEIGLLDIVNDVFYTNQGSGVFTKGNDVYPPTERVVYGVSGLYQSSTTLTRTDDAIGKNWYLVNNEIISDFDDTFPYNKMVKKTVDGNDMVYVPEMYWRFTKDANGYITDVAVSNAPFSAGTNQVVGATSEFYYGAYGGSVSNNVLKSVSGVSRQYSQTRATFRTQARANGTGYQIMDVVHKRILDMLWLIEFATKNTQDVMWGYYGFGQTTGATDTLTRPSGQLGYQNRMRWHYIEDFIGNGLECLDGITGLYVTADPSAYGDSQTGTSFSGTGLSSGNNLNALGFADESQPLLIVPKLAASNSQYNTYFCDAVELYSGNYGLFTGRAGDISSLGLFYWRSQATSYSNVNTCGRIIKIL